MNGRDLKLQTKISHVHDAKAFGYRIFVSYCAIFYFLPFFMFTFFGNPLEAFLVPRPNYYLGLMYVLLAFLLFSLVIKLPLFEAPRAFQNFARLAFDARLSIIYALCFVAFSLGTRSILGLTFRQTGAALAEVGAIGFILQFMKIYFGIAILVHCRMLYEKPNDRRRSVSLLLIGLGFLFSIQAAYDVMFVLAALLGSGLKWKRLLGLHLKSVRRLSILFIPVVIVLAGFVGVSNKVGFDEALRVIVGTDYLFRAISARLGYHFFSTSMYVSDHFLNFSLFFDAVGNVLGTLLYRGSVILGIEGVEKPEIVSVARMNYLLLSYDWKERTGASPSMIGSVFYMPGAGFAILYYVFFLRGVATLIGRIMGPMRHNVFYILLCTIIFSGVVDSFLDALNPLSPAFLRLYFLYLGAVYIVSFEKQDS